MATTSSTTWLNGFSANPGGERLAANTIIEMLERVGDELVRPPNDPDAPLMTRRELMARMLWTRALADADGAAIKLIVEYLDGKPGDAAAPPASAPVFTADDMAAAERLLRQGGRDE